MRFAIQLATPAAATRLQYDGKPEVVAQNARTGAWNRIQAFL